MVLRLLAVPAVAALVFTVDPRAVPRPAVPWKPPVTTNAETFSATEWESLLVAGPVAALRSSHARYAATVTGVRGTLVKQERLAGVLHPTEEIDLLVRETPYAVRMVWRSGARPVLGSNVEGTLYVAGENGGKMTVWRPAAFASFLRFADLSPTDGPARGASRYSLVEASPGQTIARTIAAWAGSESRGSRIEYLGRRTVPELGGLDCHVVKRTCAVPESDRFLSSDTGPAGEPFDVATIFLDAATQFQVGAELTRNDGAIVGRYYFRAMELNPAFAAGDFTRAALRK